MRTVLFVLLASLGVVHAVAENPINPERADALFAWFDQLPLPGLHGTEFVRVWPGNQWQNASHKWEPNHYLAFLVEDGPNSFRVLTPDSEYVTCQKHGVDPKANGFIGFRKISLLAEAREFLSELGAPDYSDQVRQRWFSQTFHDFSSLGVRPEVENLTLAYWCAKLGDKKLALSLLNARNGPRPSGFESQTRDSLEVELQKAFCVVLRRHAYWSLAENKLLRPELLANFKTIATLCPNSVLSEVQDAIRILERMVREDAAHPPLTDEQLAALPPAARAEELVFRLRDEVHSRGMVRADPTVREPRPDNGAFLALVNLGTAAAPALVKALDDDAFSREKTWRSDGEHFSRVRDLALHALRDIYDCNFSFPSKPDEPPVSDFEAARLWWKGVSEKGEKDYLIERIAAGDSRFPELVNLLLNRHPDEGVPFVIERINAAADLETRVFLSRALWQRDDRRCADFFTRQLLGGRELGDRVAAAYALRFRHDARALSAMRAEWEKLVAANGGSNWPRPVENIANLNSPWSVANFLATSNAPEASLYLGEHAAALPAEWRAKIVWRLGAFAGEDHEQIAEAPTGGVKKAMEDVLHSFLTDPAEFPPEAEGGADLVGAERVCDVAAEELHALWPQKYAFDRWLSPPARTRQCLAAANIRARELGEALLPLPPEPPKKSIDAKSRQIVSDVSVAEPFTYTEMGAQIAGLRGSSFKADALLSALLIYFRNPVKPMRGFALNISRYRDAPGISIHLLSITGPNISPNGYCSASLRFEDEHSGEMRSESLLNFQNWAKPEKWLAVAGALSSMASAPSAFTVALRLDSSQPHPEIVFVQ